MLQPVFIYIDNLNEYQIEDLKEAITIVNGAQSYFKISEKLKKIKISNNKLIYPNQFKKNHKYIGNLEIYTTNRKFIDNYFSHEYRSYQIISISDWEKNYAPPSLTCYLIFEICLGLVFFTAKISEEMENRFFHEPTTGCLMDQCEDKSDIKLGMAAGILCPDCKVKLLRLGANEKALNAIERILTHVRAEATGQPLFIDFHSAFIIMRFSENDENANAFEQGIKPALKDLGITPIRANDVVESSQILSKITTKIDKIRFIVAKVDVNNLNVFFELGYAMGKQKEVLLISEEKLVLKMPSDLKNWECLTYPKGKYEILKEKIYDFFIKNFGYKLEKND